MGKYNTRIEQISVRRNQHDDTETILTIKDCGAGEYVEVKQLDQSITVSPEEWPAISASIGFLIAECVKNDDLEDDVDNDDLEDDVDDQGDMSSEIDEIDSEPVQTLVVRPDAVPSALIRVETPRPTDCSIFIEYVGKYRHRVHVKARKGETMPTLTLGPFILSHDDTKLLDGWHGIQWKEPQTPRGGLGHTGRNYPHQWYSAVAGLWDRSTNDICGVSFLNDIRKFPAEIHFNYRRDQPSNIWQITAEFRRENRDPYVFPVDTSLSFDVVIKRGRRSNWLEVFDDYRDHHRAIHGLDSVEFKREPIAAVSMAVNSLRSDSNPRGFTNAPWNGGRFDQTGYEGLHDWCRDVLIGQHGFRRLMIWNSVGMYPLPGNHAMRWDISSGRTKAMIDTTHEITRSAHKLGVEVGFWWGHSMWIGEDPNGRNRTQLTNKDFETARRQILPLIRRGTIIGHDAMARRIVATEKNPDLFTAYSFLSEMSEFCRGTQWILEASASDFTHRFGGSFVWAHLLNSSDAQTWANWLHEGRRPILAVMKSDRNDVTQERFNELLDQGYTPLVFSPHRRGIVNSKGLTP